MIKSNELVFSEVPPSARPEDYYEVLPKTRKGNYYRSSIPKSGGGKRELCIPDKETEDVLKELFDILSGASMKFPECATGGLPGCGITANIYPHHMSGNRHFWQLDLEDAYGKVHIPTLIKIVDALIPEKDQEYVRWAIYEYATADIVPGLPQGAMTSPLLFNIYYMPLDEPITEFCQKEGITYTRYFDDFTFSAERPLTKRQKREIKHMIETFPAGGQTLDEKIEEYYAQQGVDPEHRKKKKKKKKKRSASIDVKQLTTDQIHIDRIKDEHINSVIKPGKTHNLCLDKDPVTITGYSLYPDGQIGPSRKLTRKIDRVCNRLSKMLSKDLEDMVFSPLSEDHEEVLSKKNVRYPYKSLTDKLRWMIAADNLISGHHGNMMEIFHYCRISEKETRPTTGRLAGRLGKTHNKVEEWLFINLGLFEEEMQQWWDHNFSLLSLPKGHEYEDLGKKYKSIIMKRLRRKEDENRRESRERKRAEKLLAKTSMLDSDGGGGFKWWYGGAE